MYLQNCEFIQEKENLKENWYYQFLSLSMQ